MLLQPAGMDRAVSPPPLLAGVDIASIGGEVGCLDSVGEESGIEISRESVGMGPNWFEAKSETAVEASFE